MQTKPDDKATARLSADELARVVAEANAMGRSGDTGEFIAVVEPPPPPRGTLDVDLADDPDDVPA